MPKKKSNQFITLAVILIYSALMLTAVYGQPPEPPHRFMGYAFDETGAFVVDDTTISAKVDNVFYNTTVKNGTYGFPTETEEYQVFASEDDIIYFYINGTPTGQTAVYEIGGLNIGFSQYLNLSFDTTPPVISGVQSSSITDSEAVISWTTDENANSTVKYGTTTQLGSQSYDAHFVTDHSITLMNLQAVTTYYYEVVSYDGSSNRAVDNNSGNYYSFTTQQQTIPPPPPPIPPTPPAPTEDENEPPVAHAGGPYYSTPNQIIYLDASNSTDSDGYIVNYTWNLGDDTSISTSDVGIKHAYATTGNYTISLTVTDNNGSTNSTTTFAYISINDADGDGWSDDAERAYNTDPNNASDFPQDTDKDGVPDSTDSDDDNDGLTDREEESLGTNPLDQSDVIRIINDYGLFYLIDTDGDTTVDTYYSRPGNFVTSLHLTEDGTFLIDTNQDTRYDFEYYPRSGSITPYHPPEEKAQTIDTMILLIIAVVVIIILLLLIYVKFRIRKK
jgi:hypothetical protein